MLQLPSYYQNKITDFLTKHFPELGSNPYDTRLLQKWVWQLSNLFRNRNSFIKGKYFMQKEMIAAYLSFIFPQSFVKTYFILQELNTLYPLDISLSEKINVLDAGGGVGSSSLSIIEFFKNNYPHTEIELDFLEINKQSALFFIETVKDSCYFSTLKHNIIFLDIEKFIKKINKNYNIIILSSVLRELELKISLIALLRKFLSHLNKGGFMILIEPALMESSHQLIELRDRLISYGIFILSPCLHNLKCPLGGNENYWCYKEVIWKPPLSIQKLNKRLFREINPLKFSYLILYRGTNDKAEGDYGTSGVGASRVGARAKFFGARVNKNYYRALTPADPQKGKFVVKVCNAEGNIKIMELLKRDISKKNKLFLKIKRGTLFFVNSIEDKISLLRIKKDSEVICFPS